MFDLVRLRVLHTVAGHGTLAAAAQALHLTPSAISQQMSKLEREAGCRLMERQGRRVRLTDEGLVLAKHAQRILAAVEEAEADLDERRGQVLGTLSIGAFPTAARNLLPGVLADCAVRYPGLQVSSYEVEPYQALGRVAGGDLDLAITQDWMNVPVAVPERLLLKELGRDPADVALPVDHPLADSPSLSLDRLVDEPWVTATEGTICHDWLTNTFRKAGHEPRIAHQAAEFPTQLALVAAGLGVALLPRLAGEGVPAGVRLVPVAPQMYRRIFVGWREEAARRPAVVALVELLAQHWSIRA